MRVNGQVQGFQPYAGQTETPRQPQTQTPEARTANPTWNAAAAVLDYEAGAKGQLQSTMKDQFGGLAQDSTKFHATMQQVFGPNYDKTKAEAFRQQALRGDFSWLPPVRLVDANTLGGANGAYDAASGTVLINRDLAMSDPKLAASTYVEEAGHHLDAKLNTVDSRGDEGELFRRVLAGEKLSTAQINEIRNENDKGVITVDGKQVEVEFWNPFKAVAKAVGGAVKAVGGAVVNTVKSVGNAAVNVVKGIGGGAVGFVSNIFKGNFGTAFEKLGSGISQATVGAASSLWNGGLGMVKGVFDGFTHLIPGVGQYLRKGGDHFFGAFSQIGNGLFNVANTFIQGWAEGAGTFAEGVKNIFQGKFGEGFKKMGHGMFKATIQNAGDMILMAGGHVVSGVQTLFGIEPVGRKLTDAEISELKKVYGNSIDYSQVVVKEGGAGLFMNTDRPFVLGNTIYMKNKKDLETLVHEMGHVWQNQNGGGDYALQALWSQDHGDGYNYLDDVLANKPWSELEPEQQAELIGEAYADGFFTTGQFTYDVKDSSGRVIATHDLTAYMKDAMKQVRAGEGAP